LRRTGSFGRISWVEELLGRGVGAESVAGAAAADTETAAVRLNEAAGRGEMIQLGNRQRGVRERRFSHVVGWSSGRSVLVQRRAPGEQTASDVVNVRSIAGSQSASHCLDHYGRWNGGSERVDRIP
jgi:hypothetical protein